MRSNDSLAAASPPPVVALAEHRDLVLQICRRWLGNVQDAEDATQETLVRALTSWHRLDPGRPLLPWLRQIAVNRCRTRRSELPETSSGNTPAPTRSFVPPTGRLKTACVWNVANCSAGSTKCLGRCRRIGSMLFSRCSAAAKRISKSPIGWADRSGPSKRGSTERECD